MMSSQAGTGNVVYSAMRPGTLASPYGTVGLPDADLSHYDGVGSSAGGSSMGGASESAYMTLDGGNDTASTMMMRDGEVNARAVTGYDAMPKDMDTAGPSDDDGYQKLTTAPAGSTIDLQEI